MHKHKFIKRYMENRKINKYIQLFLLFTIIFINRIIKFQFHSKNKFKRNSEQMKGE